MAISGSPDVPDGDEGGNDFMKLDSPLEEEQFEPDLVHEHQIVMAVAALQPQPQPPIHEHDRVAAVDPNNAFPLHVSFLPRQSFL